MEFGLGVVSGFFGTLVSHPFDTVRTCQAVDNRGSLIIARDLLRADGLRGVYSGVFSPCVSVGCWKGVVLGTHHQLQKALVRRRGVQRKEDLSYADVTGSACVAGSMGAAACSPFEMIKSRTQLGAQANAAQCGGPGKGLLHRELDNLSTLLRAQGAAGLARGLPLLFMRDFHATGFFLGTYECIMRNLRGELGWPLVPSALVSGVIAGPLGWVVCYPIEVVRILYQGDAKFKTYGQCARHVFQTRGMAGFFRGLPMCMVRSSFQIGGTMAVFEPLRTYLC